MMLLPRPIRQRSPMVTNPSGRSTWPGPHPADSATYGAITVPIPMRMAYSLTMVSAGKQMTDPSPKPPNDRARREVGPMAPTSCARSHAQRTASPARFSRPRRHRVRRVSGICSRWSIDRT
jgi:hypothetical protein